MNAISFILVKLESLPRKSDTPNKPTENRSWNLLANKNLLYFRMNGQKNGSPMDEFIEHTSGFC